MVSTRKMPLTTNEGGSGKGTRDPVNPSPQKVGKLGVGLVQTIGYV